MQCSTQHTFGFGIIELFQQSVQRVGMTVNITNEIVSLNCH
jgi:hypothetical protein